MLQLQLKNNWALLGPHKKGAIILFFLMLGSAIFEACSIGLLVPFLKTILTANQSNQFRTTLPYISNLLSGADFFLIMCILVVVIFLIKNAIIYSRSVYTTYFTTALRRYWSTALFNHYINSDYNRIISADRGKLLNNSVNEPIYASKMVGQAIDYLTRSLVVVCIYAVMLYYDFKITMLISVAVIMVLGTIWKLSTTFSIKKGEIRIQLNQRVNTLVEQALNGIRQVKLFNLNEDFSLRISKKYNELVRVLVKISLVQNIPLLVGEMLIITSFVACLVFIRYRTSLSISGIFPMLAFITIAGQRLYQNMSVIVSGRVMLLSLLPSLRLIRQLLHTSASENSNKPKPVMKLETVNGGDIIFSDVTFSHGGAKPVFENLNLRIPEKQNTAIIGSSGVGKSTLVDLIVGLYKGYGGKILISGTSLEKINLQALRGSIGYVSQDIFLFNISVKENIRMGDPMATVTQIESAAKKAYAHNFIMSLPEGYETYLGDRGQKISRGQAQRVTLARAILSDPDIFIFDEATSALDNETEKIIQNFIDALKGKKTVITIAHRLSTIQNADKIYFLKDGQAFEYDKDKVKTDAIPLCQCR